MTANRYSRGFKFCKSCHKWIKPGTEEVYLSGGGRRSGVNKHPLRCPVCNMMLKSHPQTSEGKERLGIGIAGKVLVMY